MVQENGKVACWGNDHSGHLGALNPETPPCVVQPKHNDKPLTSIQIAEAAQISLGENHVCFIDRAGQLFCRNVRYGQRVSEFEKVDLPGHARAIQSFDFQRCILLSGGVDCGDNHFKFLLQGQMQRIEMHDHRVCALTSEGEVLCRQIARKTENQRDLKPIHIALPAAAKSVHMNATHACAVTVEGALWCWTHQEIDQTQGQGAKLLLSEGVTSAVLQDVTGLVVMDGVRVALFALTQPMQQQDPTTLHTVFHLNMPLYLHPEDAHARATLEDPPPALRTEWFPASGHRYCREYCTGNHLEEVCVHRPPPPCNLQTKNKVCSRMSTCGEEGVCWFGKCLADDTIAERAEIAACFSGIFSVDYYGASPDRVYKYMFRMEPHTSKDKQLELLQKSSRQKLLLWSEVRWESFGDRYAYYSYHEMPGRMEWEGATLLGVGDTSAVLYHVRGEGDDEMLNVWQEVDAVGVGWDVIWPFNRDLPERFPSDFKVKLWSAPDAAQCWQETRYDIHLPAQEMELTVKPTRKQVCVGDKH